jgi:hypothetical protein
MFIGGFAFAGPVYKWVDAEGNVHFSDEPPPENYEAEELILETQPNESDARKSQEKLVRLQERLKRDQERRSAVREEQRLQQQSDEVLRVSKMRRCLDARYQLHELETEAPVYYVDEKGDRVYLDDSKRSEYMAFYYAEINTYCE